MKRLKIYRNKLSFLAGIVFTIFLLNFFLTNQKSNIIFEDLALGEDNIKLMGTANGIPIHCSDLSDLEKCRSGYEINDKEIPVILWLGNSQLHAINQAQPSDNVSSSMLHTMLKEHGKYTLTFSQPNANLQEHFILFAHLINIFPIETLILPIVFDDMREDEVRKNIKNALDYHETLKNIKETSTGKNLIFSNQKKDIAGNILKSKKKTLQENWEHNLNLKLGNAWTFWKERKILKSELFHKLHLLRNSVFGIKATTVRKIIYGPYKKNLKAYEDILLLAKKNKIKVHIYIPPLRNDIKFPYDQDEYNYFKTNTEKIAKKYNVNYFLLENLIPGKLWGNKDSTNLNKEKELDFMHFKGKGHILLSDALYNKIK